ncbi:rhomboid family intramembrane serine protease [Hymenobacter weizhouensis]|uniref:rhomboid family intramembrane serine protease n=1 Tax=Hymenobacter sp. YIM 151500-1 TaxID=2987689 RepID=UPI0022262392|nr:rhomboid family intramembrane serine protease [Hymenobacter sp. YIM 151500-1]UYZ63859.1 rhomboid family intramembrane serine protease [Hymenobacter sp. YIM 151500-1]
MKWQKGQRPASVWREVAPYVLPRAGYQVTPLLLLLNSVVFVVMVFRLGDVSFQASDLLAWGGNYGPLIQAGHWWRLLASGFLHGGLMHWLQNMVTLGLMGWLLERLVGPVRLVLLYLLCIVGASLLSTWWHPDTVSVGASGGIFGLFGLAAALVLSPRVPADERSVLLALPGALCAINLLLGWIMPGTDNAAHLGGLACGLVLGTLVTRLLPQPTN